MALRPIVALSLLTFALVAGCSDGPPSGDLVPIPGALNIDGSTTENTYTAESGGQPNPVPGQPKLCPTDPTETIPPCVPASSHYKIHFMTQTTTGGPGLPEPSGDGYKVYQRGGAIDERQLCELSRDAAGMYVCEVTNDSDESTQFATLELRMGDLTVASASSAAGSQAFVLDPALAAVTVTGSYHGRVLELDVSGLPEGPIYSGRFYKPGLSGNLTSQEAFPVVNGGQEIRTELADVGDYVEFHIHVGESKIYVYQATL